MPICENITYTEYIKRACFIEEQMQNHSQLHSPPHFKKASYASLHLMLDLTESRWDQVGCEIFMITKVTNLKPTSGMTSLCPDLGMQ